ncbi:MAG: acyl-CoA dehydrogenase family protein [Actinomycetota bacterium]|nr:acyl-CoA dehydrogenase family protein [Actinomycetota bacterium]
MAIDWYAGGVMRRVPTAEAAALLDLTYEIATKELRPRADEAEAAGYFPREMFTMLGELGLMSLPYEEQFGGGNQSHEVSLQVLEELSRAWMSVAVGVSVHHLACFPLANFGTDVQQRQWLPDLLGGKLLGAYCLSEPESGSDAAALTTRAVADGDDYVVNGTKAWITHGGVADFYNLMVRTSDDGVKGISCLLVNADTPGLSAATPEHKMGGNSSPTAQIRLVDARVAKSRRIAAEGGGFTVALAALDAGRLGIAACAVGLAQAALDAAIEYSGVRVQFGRPIRELQGVAFMLADMATSVAASRALYLEAARRMDAGLNFTSIAAMAKLLATDSAMKVTTDAIQVFGGAGYTRDFPVERYFREAKVLQIVEGTNQVQRMVIGRNLGRELGS